MAARKVESRRKRRRLNCELYANPNASAPIVYRSPRMNGNFRPLSWVMQYHLRAEKRPRIPA